MSVIPIVEFLVLINPFALFLYLVPVMKELDNKTFVNVLLRATLISFCIFAAFLLSRTFLFDKIFQIHIESFRIFGGIIMFAYAYLYIIRGDKAFIRIKGEIDDLPSDIALPFMVGAGTISLSIFLGQSSNVVSGLSILVITLAINFGIIMGMKFIRERVVHAKMRVVFDRFLDVFLRINGFFVGSIGIDMLRYGIENLYL